MSCFEYNRVKIILIVYKDINLKLVERIIGGMNSQLLSFKKITMNEWPCLNMISVRINNLQVKGDITLKEHKLINYGSC